MIICTKVGIRSPVTLSFLLELFYKVPSSMLLMNKFDRSSRDTCLTLRNKFLITLVERETFCALHRQYLG